MTIALALGAVAAIGLIIARQLPCVLCRDGWESSSSGGHGTCSHHGGIDR